MWEIIPALPSGRFSFTSASYDTQETGCVSRDAGAVTCESHLQSSGEGSSGSSLLSPSSAESFLSPAPGLSEESRIQPSSALRFQSAHQLTIITISTLSFKWIISNVSIRRTKKRVLLMMKNDSGNDFEGGKYCSAFSSRDRRRPEAGLRQITTISV